MATTTESHAAPTTSQPTPMTMPSDPAPTYSPRTNDQRQDLSFIQHEPPMSYAQPSEKTSQVQPVHEANPRMVTPLEQLGLHPADVDCPYCRKVVRTEVREVSSDDDGMMQCLICLVCWPMLFCYEGNKDINQHCTVCKRQLTHKPHSSGQVQVVARPQAPAMVPSQFEQV